MSRRTLRTAVVLLAGLAAAGPVAAPAAESAARVRVTRVHGDPLVADAWTAADGEELVFAQGDAAARVAVGDVVEVSLGNALEEQRTPAADEVALELWSGEELRGRIVGGDDLGIDLETPLIGRVRVNVDHVAGARFLQRLAQAADPPDLAQRHDGDVVHLVGGDRVDCTISSFTADALHCATATSDDVAVPYARIVALRLVAAGAAPPERARFTAVLRDGTRAAAAAVAVDAGRLVLRSVSGFDVRVSLREVVTVLVRSASIAYLSDLPGRTLVVKPFWEPVAGDPQSLYAPRDDRAFSGGPLRADGRTWTKGIGAYSGTELTWQLDGTWREFRTQVAIDDAAGRLGGAVFEVVVDGTSRWKSPLVRPARDAAGEHGTPGPVDAGRIDVGGAKSLTLRVLAGDAQDPYPIQDEADWLGAMLVR